MIQSNRLVFIVILAAALGPVFSLTAHGQAVTTERELSEPGVWTVTDEPLPGSAERMLARARQSLAAGRYRDARAQADAFIDRYPDHTLTPEAYLLRGEALYYQREYYKALYDYEYVARVYPGSEAFLRALEREYEIAVMFARGVKRKIWGLRWGSAYSEAEELLIRIQERTPGSQLAERAGRALAELYYRRRDMESATIAYDLFLQNHPEASDLPDAMRRLIYAHLATYRGPRFDPSGLYEARSWLERMEVRYPAEAQAMGSEGLRRRIDESDAEQMYAQVSWYLRRNDPVSALFVMKRLIRVYPDTVAAGLAYDQMVERGWLEVDEIDPPVTADTAAATDDERSAEESAEEAARATTDG
ncbi:MAG: outer membrane protein assembly factor BamD [Phycisphaerales bacterium]